MNLSNNKIKDILLCVIGGVGYALTISLFIEPLNFVSGTITGIAQLLAGAVCKLFSFSFAINLTGIFLILINIPLLWLGKKISDNNFLSKTIITLVSSMFVYSIVPVPTNPLIPDPLTASIVAGGLTGFFGGLPLQGGGSSGGLDVLGLYITGKSPDFSVGKVTIAVSMFVYALVFVRNDFNVMLYSIIFTLISASIVDRIHYQNVKVTVWIISSKEDLSDILIGEINRSATRWEGTGIYKNQKKYVYFTALTKYEFRKLKKLMKIHDSSAFMVVNNDCDFVGYFPLHLKAN